MEQHRQRPYRRGRAEPQPGAERVGRRCAQHGTGHGDLRHMPGRLPHCRCLNSSLLRPNGTANGRKDHRQQQALFILMAPAQQQARGNYSRPPRQKPQQGAQPAVGLRADKYRRWAICSANNANGAVGLRSPCLPPVFQLVPK